MGTCYYLIRRDTRTAYDLGKAYFLRHVFGEGSPLHVAAGDVDTLVALALAAQRGDLDGGCDVSLHRGPDEAEETYAYWRAVMLDVLDWSEGQSFELHSEHSALYEEMAMDGWERRPPRERLFRTGDRHDDVAVMADGSVVRWSRASRDDLARRRQADEAFRRGRVWIDPRSGSEIPSISSGREVI
jgi:hypothetical protein